MTEHKMVTIDGVRYRPEDVQKAPRTRRERVLGTSLARQTREVPVTPPADTGPFDPAKATVEQVLEHLDGADHAEAVRVLDAEAEDKARTTILGRRDEILAAKEDAGDGDSGGASS